MSVLRCRKCGGDSHVTDSRPIDGTTRRRRECKKCGERWTTIEIIAEDGDLERAHLVLVPRRHLRAILEAAHGIEDGLL